MWDIFNIEKTNLLILCNHKCIETYLYSNCDLLKGEKVKDLKNKKNDVKIFIECYEWAKNKGKEKVFELMYNSNIDKEQCVELLALAIVDKIKEISENQVS